MGENSDEEVSKKTRGGQTLVRTFEPPINVSPSNQIKFFLSPGSDSTLR